jgi:hypothetical protein
MSWKRWFPLGWKRECGFLLASLILFFPTLAFILLADESTFEPDTLIWFLYAGGVQVGLMALLSARYYMELRAARVRKRCPVCGGDPRLTHCYHGHCQDAYLPGVSHSTPACVSPAQKPRKSADF